MNNLEKEYKISRIVLTVIAFIVFNIMFINEDISWKILPIVFSIIVYIISGFSKHISKLIIKYENKISSKVFKVIYYLIILPIIILGVSLIIYYLVISLSRNGSLSNALILLFFITVGVIAIILPYIQTLIVLIIKRIK